MIDPSIITTSQYVKALKADRILREGDLEILNLMYNQPNHEASATEIACTLGLPNVIVVNRIFGGLGKRIKNHLNVRSLDDFYGWYFIAFEGSDDQQFFPWRLRPNFVRALERLNLVTRGEMALKTPVGEMYEGVRRRVISNQFERNLKAREKCLEYYGKKCQGCNDEKRYGKILLSVIQVHHTYPISMIGKKYKIDPIKDLIPLCPNCHAIVHTQSPPLSLKELRKLLP